MKSVDLFMVATILLAGSFGSSWGQNASTGPFETASPSDGASMIGTSNMGTSYPSETATVTTTESEMIGTPNMGTSYPSEMATTMTTESETIYISDGRISIPPTQATTMLGTDLGTENDLVHDELASLYLAETEYNKTNIESMEETVSPTLADTMDVTYISTVHPAGEGPEMDTAMDMMQDDQTMPPTQHDTMETTEMSTIAYSKTLSPSIATSIMVSEMDTATDMLENGLTQVPSEVSTETGTEMESTEDTDTMPPTQPGTMESTETMSPSIAATIIVTESATTTDMLENGLTQVPSEVSTETETEDVASLVPTETEATGVAGETGNAISTLSDADCLPDMPCGMCEGGQLCCFVFSAVLSREILSLRIFSLSRFMFCLFCGFIRAGKLLILRITIHNLMYPIKDCDDDSDCQGELKCFRRIGDEVNPVPGCSGEGAPGQDYCYMPAEHHLRLRDVPCSVDDPCKVCEGGMSEWNIGASIFHNGRRLTVPYPPLPIHKTRTTENSPHIQIATMTCNVQANFLAFKRSLWVMEQSPVATE